MPGLDERALQDQLARSFWRRNLVYVQQPMKRRAPRPCAPSKRDESGFERAAEGRASDVKIQIEMPDL
ncbi:hypothetical protein AX761_07155 [Rhizobium sp. 58]|nr:hypothetical protein AX761_07155 [Rhizobium sp. 58]